MDFKDLQAKLIELTKRNISQTDISKALNVTRSNISLRIKNKSPLNTQEIEKIENYFNTKLIDYNSADLDDLHYCGTLSKTLEESTDFIRVPYYPQLEASCGQGIFAPKNNPNADFFPISTKYGLNKHSKYFIINAFGDSMEPTIEDKQYVIFEEWREKQIVDNKVYFFCYENKLYIKRLAYNIDEIVVMSDNKKYDKKIISKSEISKVTVFGRFKGLIEND